MQKKIEVVEELQYSIALIQLSISASVAHRVSDGNLLRPIGRSMRTKSKYTTQIGLRNDLEVADKNQQKNVKNQQIKQNLKISAGVLALDKIFP